MVAGEGRGRVCFGDGVRGRRQLDGSLESSSCGSDVHLGKRLRLAGVLTMSRLSGWSSVTRSCRLRCKQSIRGRSEQRHGAIVVASEFK